MRFVGFIGPTYELDSVNADCQQCINLYPELNELGTGKDKEIARFVGTPGLNTLVTLPTLGHRGSFFASNDILYVVVGNTLYKVSSTWAYTSLGTLVTSSGQVSMDDNGLQLVIVDGVNGYVWDFTLLTFVQITDPAWLGATMVSYQDGTFIFNKPGTNKFYISGLNAVTFDGADISSKEGAPDPIVAHLSDHRNIWLFGEKTTEVWYNSGDALFPFARIEGAFIETGCAAAFSIAKLNGTVIWLGQDKKGIGIVYEASGFQPVRISNQAVERSIQSYSKISDAVAWTYQDDGHSFYVLNFPTANATWVFDSSTRLWHERGFLVNGIIGRHLGQTAAFAYGALVVGDYQNGNLYQLTRAAYSDAGTAIVRRRRAPHISSDMVRQFFKDFQLDIEVGTGIDGSGQGVDPQAVLRWSNDGGHTWSNEKWTSIGPIGHTKARVIWRRLGQARDRVFEVTISDPVKVAIIGAELNFEPGMS